METRTEKNSIEIVNPSQLDQVVGGDNSLPPLPTRTKNTLLELVKTWKAQGCTLDEAVFNAKSMVGGIYSDSVEDYVRSVWPTL